MSDNYRKLVSNLRETHDKDAELTRLRASHAELLAACRKVADYYNTDASFDLMDAVDMCIEAVAHAREAPT